MFGQTRQCFYPPFGSVLISFCDAPLSLGCGIQRAPIGIDFNLLTHDTPSLPAEIGFAVEPVFLWAFSFDGGFYDSG